MSWEQNHVVKISRAAEADLSAKQYQFVTVGASGGVAAVDAQGEDCLGVLQNKPTLGKLAVVMIAGVSKLKLGGTVEDGAIITTGSTGLGEPALTGDFVMGKSVQGASGVTTNIITASISCISNMVLP